MTGVSAQLKDIAFRKTLRRPTLWDCALFHPIPDVVRLEYHWAGTSFLLSPSLVSPSLAPRHRLNLFAVLFPLN